MKSLAGARARLFGTAAGLALIWAGAALAVTPAIPASLRPPAGEKRILATHARGAQIYVCQAGADGGPRWTLKAPDAQLRDAKGRLIIHHFAGPTWKHVDGSLVTGKVVAHVDSPDPRSVPWLLLTVTGHSGDGVLMHVTSVQRLHTRGGQPPATGCDRSRLGTEARSPYTADYYFYAPVKM